MIDDMHYASFCVAAKKLSMTFRQNLKINFKVMSLSQISKALLGTVASCSHERWSSKWVAALNTQESNLSSCSSWEGYRNSAGTETTPGCKKNQRSQAQQVKVSFLLFTTSALSTLFLQEHLFALYIISQSDDWSRLQTAEFTNSWPIVFLRIAKESWTYWSSWRSCMFKNKNATIFHQLLLVGGIWRF